MLCFSTGAVKIILALSGNHSFDTTQCELDPAYVAIHDTITRKETKHNANEHVHVLGKPPCLLFHKDALHTIRLNIMFWLLHSEDIHENVCFILFLLLFLIAVCPRLSLHARITRLLFPQLCYLFCDFPQAISLSISISLSLSGWPSTGFISSRSSVCLLCFFLCVWGGD